LIILYCIYRITTLVTCLFHTKIIDTYQVDKYSDVLLADVLHGTLLLAQLCRCSDQPSEEGSWVLTWGATPPQGGLTSARGAACRGAARRGSRLATRHWARWRGSAQERSARHWPARNGPNAARVSRGSGKRERRVCASRWSTTVPRLLW